MSNAYFGTVKISTRGRYALRALADLAKAAGNEARPVALREIAARQDLSEKYLESLFSSLRAAGIVQSQRGSRGGYVLQEPPHRTSALDVIRAINGPVSIVDCCTSTNRCDRIRGCKTHRLWKDINQQIVSKLEETTIQDLV